MLRILTHNPTIPLDLEGECFQVEDLDDAISICQNLSPHEVFDAIVIETNDPVDISHVRASGMKLVIVALVQKRHDNVETRVRFLNKGADYVFLANCPEALIDASILAGQRRIKNSLGEQVDMGKLIIERATKEVFFEGERVHLTGREFELLDVLVSRPDRPVSKEFIHLRLYGSDSDVQMKIIDVLTCKINKKLAPFFGRKPIKTHWGMGVRYATKGEVHA